MGSNLVKFLLCTFLPIKTDGNEDSWKRTCVLPLVLRVCMLKEIQGFQNVIIREILSPLTIITEILPNGPKYVSFKTAQGNNSSKFVKPVIIIAIPNLVRFVF